MRAIITGGGTGGHIYPALAIADELRRRVDNMEILYVGPRAWRAALFLKPVMLLLLLMYRV